MRKLNNLLLKWWKVLINPLPHLNHGSDSCLENSRGSHAPIPRKWSRLPVPKILRPLPRPDRFDLKPQFTTVIRGTGSASSTSATPSPTSQNFWIYVIYYALRNKQISHGDQKWMWGNVLQGWLWMLTCDLFAVANLLVFHSYIDLGRSVLKRQLRSELKTVLFARCYNW